jgi:Asp-tRNA(Asn)/Glu-tRNA(Gln) amidotransferase A subunit family amidase
MTTTAKTSITGTGLTALSASQAAAKLQAGEVSAEAYVTACLDRIAQLEPDVKAWEYLDRDHALAQARALDEARRSGKAIGPLHGLPVGIKDIIDTADMPTQNGSPLFKDHQPTRDSACVAALRAAGAVIMGKTVTTELANTHPGKTHNPHNLGHTPGGSSSGSAAAVACGMVPLALGTQTGGSVIRPASFCGIWGMKPTVGFISRRGVTLQSHTLDTVGVYGRSAEDLALIAEALSGHDIDDPVSYPRSRPHLVEAVQRSDKAAPRFGFFRTPVWDKLEPEAVRAVEGLVRRLASDCKEVKIPALDRIVEWHSIVIDAEDAAYYGPLMERSPDDVSASLKARLQNGAKISAPTYIQAINGRNSAYDAFEKIMADYTALVVPASTGPAPKSLASTGNAVFNGLWTLLGVPCVTVPLLEVNSLPYGIQLVGRRQDEARLLQAARWLNQRLAQ